MESLYLHNIYLTPTTHIGVFCNEYLTEHTLLHVKLYAFGGSGSSSLKMKPNILFTLTLY